jgi:hypothetical protein
MIDAKDPLIVRKGRIMAVDINELNGMFVVEWNRKRKHLHIQALGEILKGNLIAVVNGRDSGYVPVAIAQTKGEAVEMCRLIEVNLRSLPRRRPADSTDTLQ